MDWHGVVAFGLLGAAVLASIVAWLRTRRGIQPPLPTQLWLQDFIAGAVAYGAALSLLSTTGEEWFVQAPLRSAIMTAAALLAAAEACRAWPRLQRPLPRALAVGACCAAFLWLGGTAVLLWWLVRTSLALFCRRRKPEAHELSRRIFISSGWVFFCALIYAVAFPLPTGIKALTSEIPGWDAYAEFSRAVVTPFNIDPFVNLSDVPWTANVFLWLSVAFFMEARFGLAVCSSGLAVLCSVSFYFAPDPSEFCKLCPAYHLWLSAMGVMLAGSAVAFIGARRDLRAKDLHPGNTAPPEPAASSHPHATV